MLQLKCIHNVGGDTMEQIDETKKTFKLKTFIHDLYKKLTEKEKNDTEHNSVS